MTDQNNTTRFRPDAVPVGHWMDWPLREAIIFRDETFTRSNGSIVSRLYERLTKASRRRYLPARTQPDDLDEQSYRRGVYDAYKALQEELQS